MSTPTAIEHSKTAEFCQKLGYGIGQAATFVKEQGSRALIGLRDLAKKVAEFVGPHLKKGTDFAMQYSKTHKDQIFLATAGAAVGGLFAIVFSKMCCNNTGNPNGGTSYSRV